MDESDLRYKRYSMTRVLVIRQWHFPLDPSARRAVEALLGAGYEVDVLCTRGEGERLRERDGPLRVYRLPLWHRRGGLIGYGVEYLVFLVFAAVAAAVLHAQRRYRLVEVHTPPDVLAFSAALPKACGARVLLDLQECMPEFFSTKVGIDNSHPAVRLVGAVEQAAIRFADASLTRTNEMKNLFVERGADPKEITVILNSADEAVFRPGRVAAPSKANGSFTLICHGAIESRYGLDTAIHALALVATELPDVRLQIFGDGSDRSSLQQLSEDLGVSERVEFSDGYVPIDELVAAIDTADAGLVAIKRDAFRDVTQCFKMYEYVAMRRPVIASRTASAVAAFDDDCFAWFESDNATDLARAIREVHDDASLRERLVERAAQKAESYRWTYQRERYLGIVRALVSR
jgi:glycosyltransferase involved in cell wall biosynthesis